MARTIIKTIIIGLLIKGIRVIKPSQNQVEIWRCKFFISFNEQATVRSVQGKICMNLNNRAPYRLFEGKSMSPIMEESEERPVVLLFTADWLGSAHILESFLIELAPKYPDVVIYKIDVEVNQKLPAELGISQVPTTVFLRDGEIQEYVLGILSKKRLKEKFELILSES